MGTYRSPAVALMPDVTPKPLRSRANAIINLMGAVGGILYLVITSVLYSSSRVAGLEHVNYLPLFAIVAGIMAVSVGILFAAIREKKLHEENMALEAEHPEWNLAEVDESGNEKLPSAVRRSLGFLLASLTGTVLGVLTVIAACPSGAMITILSLRYGVDETFATRVNFVSTVLCAGTLPLVTHILL